MQREYDVVVVGAGPAGMAGAISAYEQGLSVLLLDEQPAPGGQIWRAVERNAAGPLGRILGTDYQKGAELAEKLRSSRVDLLFGAKVWQVEDGFGVFMSVDGRTRSVKARAVLLATGAQERPNPFPGWTLPGVMSVGAAQILIKNAASIPDQPVWIAGTGPLPLLYMTQLLELGGSIAGYIDTAPCGNFRRALPHLASAMKTPKGLVKGLGWLTKLRRAGVPHFRGAHGLEALGDERLRAIRFRTAAGETIEAGTDILLAHEGVVPNVHFPMAMGCEHDWDDAQLCFVPRLDRWGESTREGVFIAGDGGGIAGADAAVELGRIAGLGVSRKLDVQSSTAAEGKASGSRRSLRRLLAIRPFLDALYRPRPEVFSPAPQTLVCRCECLTAATVREVAARGAADCNGVKVETRAGMGPCQGRQCGYTVASLVAQQHGLPMASVGYFRIRPPLKPVTLGELAAFRD
ncbi:NAD(P)/FAD-dependent oxidoreductase [Chelativorans xinjiangense]|uniref:FAD/NAD(P)-dependent oxidoreductase n=1 Tax=Chelativorans xinjiangense TaxID=2681485 RepID=UPI00135CD5E7|nr:NAD(P)/FAD-dependent oxidoreductase [Chelativorans xinjiangense]